MKRGQVWIETVIYMLIAFSMIALVLTYAKPKIEEMQDKAIIEQKVAVMAELDSIIKQIAQSASGNKRLITLDMKQGSLTIDGPADKLTFELKGRYAYTEPNGGAVLIGAVKASTTQNGKFYTVKLEDDYSGRYDIRYGEDARASKEISQSSTPYKIFISNKNGNIIQIDIE